MIDFEIIIPIVLLVLVIALFVISTMKKKKINSELVQMREDLKVGDKVMTDSGIVGQIVETFVEDEYMYAVLKTGKGKNEGFITVHGNSVYYVFGKEKQDAPRKIVVAKPEAKKEEKAEAKEEKAETKEEKAETKKEKKSEDKKD